MNSTVWDPARRLLRTRLSGLLSLEDVERWQADLQKVAEEIPAGEPFKVLIDIRGYEVADQVPEVHRQQREVMPRFLARHGFTVGFFDLFEEENRIPADMDRGRCVSVAHVHHDCAKMQMYSERLGSEREGFFCRLEEAEDWLHSMEIVDLKHV